MKECKVVKVSSLSMNTSSALLFITSADIYWKLPSERVGTKRVGLKRKSNNIFNISEY